MAAILSNLKNKYFDNNLDVVKPNGVGRILFLIDALSQLSNKKINEDDIIEITREIESENKLYNIKFYEGEVYSVAYLLQLFVVTLSPQIALLLSTYINKKTGKKSLTRIHELAQKLEIDLNSAVNITGRSHKQYAQNFSIYDIEKIIKEIDFLSHNSLKYLRCTQCVHKFKKIENKTKLFDSGIITHALFIFEHNIFVAIDKKNKKFNYVIIFDSIDDMNRDIVTEFILSANNKIKKIKEKNLGYTKSINIGGDFYLGEWYARRRKAKGIVDYYTENGAEYCYRQIKPLFNNNSINLINSESSIVDYENIESPYKYIKKFILDSNPEKIFPALKDLNIHALLLANNHSNDFGEEGLKETINYLNKNNVNYIGVGDNLFDAISFYKIESDYYNIYIFSIYWFRATPYYDYDSYATIENMGVATITDILLKKIKEIKQNDEKAFVIISPHWGVDFKKVVSYQRQVARNLIDNEADLIIGHGSHSLQTIEKYNDKYIIYSLGNLLFNSDGEFEAHQAPKFGLLANLSIEKNISIRLKVIDANNQGTKWQPKLIDADHFSDIIKFYEKEIEKNIICINCNELYINL